METCLQKICNSVQELVNHFYHHRETWFVLVTISISNVFINNSFGVSIMHPGTHLAQLFLYWFWSYLRFLCSMCPFSWSICWSPDYVSYTKPFLCTHLNNDFIYIYFFSGAFLLCWTPYSAILIWSVVKSAHIPVLTSAIPTMLTKTGSCLTPLVYLWRNRKMQKVVMEIYPCLKSYRRKRPLLTRGRPRKNIPIRTQQQQRKQTCSHSKV